MSAYQHEKHFTLSEARDLLPWLTGKVERIGVLFNTFEDRGFDVVTERWRPGGNGQTDTSPPEEFEEFISLIAELDRKGVLIKNFKQGVVDFPHILPNGREVYLCWMLGEATVSFRHEILDGFMGRRPVEGNQPEGSAPSP